VKKIGQDYTFERTKVEFLKYVRRNLEQYSVDGRSLIEGKKLEINLIKELVMVGIEKTIKGILIQVRGELTLSEPKVRIFDKEMIEKLNEPMRSTLVEEVDEDIKVQSKKVSELLEINTLKEKCDKYKV
jgi:hypothetical protein